MIIVGAGAISAFLNSVETRFHHLKIARQYSIKSYIQVIKILVFSLTLILVISVFINKSPMYFLTGLGAMTAVLLVIFRDSLLGFTASIQLATNDMIRIGDWIQMPNFDADGTVIDISLNTIKVQNFDNTIVTIPSYALMSHSVKNWRGMSESGGRRIKRAIFIDIRSVKFCSRELFARLTELHLLSERLENLPAAFDQGNDNQVAKLADADKHCLTNLALFRMYLEEYLRRHPSVHDGMTLMVRELQAEAKGIPVELYLFSSDVNWVNYEKLQADIFDYVYAVLPLFDLQAFQDLSGSVSLMPNQVRVNAEQY